MQLNFHFGKKETTMKTWVQLTLLIHGGIPFLARLLHVKESSLYAFLDEIVRKYFPQSVVNEFFIKDDKLLSERIDRDLSNAEENYINSTYSPTISSPEYTSQEPDGSKAQDLLGGEMSIGNNFTEK
jgi:hypothetical protein